MVAYFQKKQKGASHNVIIFLGGIFIICIVIILVIADIKMYQKRAMLNSRIENLQHSIANMENKNTTLQESILKVDDTAYTEKIAREELDLQQPGEKVFSFIKTPNTEQPNNQTGNVWQGWLYKIKGWFSK